MVLLMSVLFGFHGIIENDTTWSDTAYLTGDVLVQPGVILTISPGTVVLYADTCEWDTAWYEEGSSYPRNEEEEIDLIVEGNLKAIGAISDSILFRYTGEYNMALGCIIVDEGWDSLSYCSVLSRWGQITLYMMSAEGVIENCRFEDIGGIVGEDSRLLITRCDFDTLTPYGIRLKEGNLFLEQCSFTNTHLGEEYPWSSSVIHADSLDTCYVNGVVVDEVKGVWAYWCGGSAAGVSCFGCQYVRILNSEFRRIWGGNGEPSMGLPGNGGRGVGLYLNKCSCVLVRGNVIQGVGGGTGTEGSMEYDGRGGNGCGLSIIDCTVIYIDSNKIYGIYGGHGTSAPEDEYDGTPWPMICTNSSPSITNNEFNSSGIYIDINETSQPIIGGAEDKGNRFFNLEGKGDYVIYNDSPYDIDATYNYWDPFPQDIDSLIFDYYDDPTKGIVHYDHATDVEEEPEPAPQALIVKSNLVGDILHVSFAGSLSGGAKLELFDASGRKILSQAITEPQTAINVSDLSQGVYFVSAKIGESKRLVRKVIIK